MPTWMPENTAKRVINHLASGTAIPAEGPREVVLFSMIPTPAGDATDGVEAAPRQPLTAGAATGSTGARTAEADMTAPLTFTLLVPSSEVVGIGIADATTGALRLVNDTWKPKRQDIAAGGVLLIDADELELVGSRVP